LTDQNSTDGQELAGLPIEFRDSAEAVLASRGQESRLRRIVDRSRLPMVIVDDQRRYLEANFPAQLAFRLRLDDVRRLRVDDLTPPDRLGEMARLWQELIQTGRVAGSFLVATPDGGRFEISFWGLANVLPGRHVAAFGLAGPREEEPAKTEAREQEFTSPLTPRELEVLQLAADGLSGPRIAEKFVLSPDTVRTHFANIYEKLGVRGRPGAVAKGMRLGLIE
jgi:DNA-binding CsgD family transcriptional regulator